MELNYHLPSPRLLPLLTVLGGVAMHGRPADETVPAMLPNLHLRIAGRSTYAFADGSKAAAPAAALLGPSPAAFGLRMSADYGMLFVGLPPLGWCALIPLRADPFTGRIVDAGLI